MKRAGWVALLAFPIGGLIGYWLAKKSGERAGVMEIARDVLINFYGLTEEEYLDLMNRMAVIGDALSTPPITKEKQWMLTNLRFLAMLATEKRQALLTGEYYAYTGLKLEEHQRLYNLLAEFARAR